MAAAPKPVAAGAAPTLASEAPVPLPEGWKEYKNEAGKPYYHNKLTKTTTWKRPKADADTLRA